MLMLEILFKHLLIVIICIFFIFFAITDEMHDDLNKKTDKFLSKNKYKIILLIYFIIESIQQCLLFVYQNEVNLTYHLALAATSLISWVYLFSKFKGLSINERAILFILGAYQIAIYITATSLDSLNVDIKLIFNFLYVLMPAFVMFELSKPKK